MQNYSLTGLRGPRPANARDLTGFTFSMWTVMSWAGSKSGRGHWNCQCSCGTKAVVAHAALMHHVSQSCGKTTQCSKVPPSYAPAADRRFQNLAGNEYDDLTVLQHQGKVGNHQYWQCLCSCGVRVSKTSTALLRGVTHRSCGHETKLDGTISSRFEQQKEDEYLMIKLWLSLLRQNQNEICDRWLRSFDNFRTDVGKQPTSSHRLARVDWRSEWSGCNSVWTKKDMDVDSRRK